jgi:hypothetical protein
MPSDPNVLIIPEQALLFRAEGMQVALVGADNKVHLQDVKLGLNLGQTVQVVSGLTRSDRLIVNPSAGILEGERVRIVSGAPGVALSPQFQAAAPVPANLSAEQRAKVEAARNDSGK